jgi:hypothetical protein
MSEVPRQAVIAAGAEVLQAAVSYVDARNDDVATIALIPLYQRLENAVAMFHEVTDE